MSSTPRPNLFIVGVPKAGTTSMHNYLAQHPEIFMSPMKEPAYFCSDFNFFQWQYKKLEDYLSLFKSASHASLIGESTAVYMYSEIAAEKIKEFCPTAKIIVMLRHPADMLYSWHTTLLFMGFEDVLDFEQALAVQDERRLGKHIPKYCQEPKLLLYFEVAKFSSQIKRYFDLFGRENVHVILFEDFSQKTAQVYRQALDFLGVNPDFEPVLTVQNSSKSLTIPNLAVRSFLYKYPTFKATFNKFVPRKYIEIVRNLLGKVTQTQKNNKIEPAFRKRLIQHFKPEIHDLSTLLERDLSYWID